MGLNVGQQAAVDETLHEIFEGEYSPNQGHTIIGEGGTGKTFCVTEIARVVIEAGHSVLFAAPTHKALKQIQRSCRENGLISNNIGFATIYSALGLGMMPADEDKFITPFKESIIGNYDVLVVDEISMMPKLLVERYLLPELEQTGTYPLFMGDDMQLPPVKEAKAVAFDLFKTSELTENQRQLTNEDGTPNGILQLARAIRPCIKEKRVFRFDFTVENNVTCVKDKDFLSTILDHFTLDTDLEQTRVLAWRNFRVDDLNRAIRKKVYGPDAARFEIGERVITGGSIKDANDEVVLTSAEECIVMAERESQLVYRATNEPWKTRLLTLRPCYAGQKQVFAHVLHEDEKERYNNVMGKLKKKALDAVGNERGLYWRRFHEFRDAFADIRYCFCMTTHLAQGSTYDTVFVDVKDILENPQPMERRKLIYVGFSRPRKELVINKTSFIA